MNHICEVIVDIEWRDFWQGIRALLKLHCNVATRFSASTDIPTHQLQELFTKQNAQLVTRAGSNLQIPGTQTGLY
jgi:hypothetical protein